MRFVILATTSRGSIDEDRNAMIRNIKLSGGTCVFLGKIEGGVQIEKDLAEKWGCNIIEIS